MKTEKGQILTTINRANYVCLKGGDHSEHVPTVKLPNSDKAGIKENMFLVPLVMLQKDLKKVKVKGERLKQFNAVCSKLYPKNK